MHTLVRHELRAHGGPRGERRPGWCDLLEASEVRRRHVGSAVNGNRGHPVVRSARRRAGRQAVEPPSARREVRLAQRGRRWGGRASLSIFQISPVSVTT